jgi:hypothetical protein
MCRCLGRACAGVLLLAVAGCTLDSFVAPQSVVYGPKQVVPGTVAAVSAKLQDGLSEAGIMLAINRVGADLRIGGVSKTRTAFCLHLREKKVDGAIKTLVRMQWDRGGDADLWQLVLKILSTSDDAGAAKPLQQPLTTARSAP